MSNRDRAPGLAASSAERVTWPVRSGVFPPLADCFSARPETAPGLKAALVPGTTVVLASHQVAARGTRSWLGSCGKTQLAVYVAESLWQAGEVDLLAWVSAGSRASVLTGYLEAAVAAMGIPVDGDAESIASRFVRWLNDTDRRWLMVLDDLSDAAHLDGLWPAGATGKVLVTSANPEVLAGARQTLVLPVGVYSPREALSYLMGRLAADPDQRLGAIDLVDDLRCEPLALTQASAVIASSSLTCRDYRERYARRRDQFADTANKDPSAAEVAWTLSVDQAERLSPGGSVELLLAFGAVLDGTAIPGGLFTTRSACSYLAADGDAALAEPRRAWDEVLNLERAGVLTIDVGDARSVRMSPVIQAAVRTAMPEQMLGRAANAAAAALLEAWPAQDTPAWVTAALRSCTAGLQRVAGGALWAGGGCHPLLVRAGQSLDNARLTGPAVSYWGELVTASDRVLGPDHSATLLAGQRLAGAYLVAGRPEQAISWFQWVLAGRARALGPDHPDILAVQISLGHALVAAGQPDDAVAVMREASIVCERLRGSDSPDTLATRDEYAAACCAAGRYADAIPSYKRTLADRERVQGGRHPDTITTRQKLADAYLASGQDKQALSQHKRALSDREQVAGREHPDTIAARASLASAYFATDRVARALQLFEQVSAESERLLGPDHPDTLARRAKLADIYYSAGLLTDARILLRDIASRCERVLPAGDPLSQAILESLGKVTDGLTE
ncbi:MAG TPA: tetratricopeptide repeat protein [Streptosporangiaceae bacterium]